MLLSEAAEMFDRAMYGEIKAITRSHYSYVLQHFIRFLGDMPVTKIASDDLRRWRLEAFNDYSLHTRNGYLRSTNRFFSFLVNERIIQRNPAKNLRETPTGPPEPKSISMNDFKRMVKAAQTTRHPLRNEAILATMLDTGIRVSSLVSMSLSTLDLTACTAIVQIKSRKVADTRKVPFTPLVAELIRNYIYNERPLMGADELWLGDRGPLTTRGVYQVTRTLGKVGGATGPHNPHAFRHAFSIMRLMAGQPLTTVSRLLHHSSVVITDRYYAAYTSESLHAQQARYSPFRTFSDPDQARPKGEANISLLNRLKSNE